MRPVYTVAALLLAAAFVALGVRSFHEGTARTRPVVLPFEVFWCAKDEDCTVVDRIGCCSCSEGGAQAAITEWRRDELRRFLKRACQPGHVCIQIDVCRSDVVPRCVDRRCTLEVEHDG